MRLFVDNVASHYGEDDFRLADVMGIDFEDVAIEHDQVSGFADFERTFIFFQMPGECGISRIALDGMGNR